MYLYSLYTNYGLSRGFRPIDRLNNYGLFQNSQGNYECHELTSGELCYASRYLVDAETILMVLYKNNPMVIMADIEFCDLEYNDSILTNSTAFICEYLASGRAISIKPKAL